MFCWRGSSRGVSVETRSGTAIEIGVTGRANANASIASSGSFVGVAWAARTKDGVTDVYVATSRDGGRAFGAPVRVNQVPGDASVSGEQPPRIVLSARGSTTPAVVVLWTAKSASGTRLVSARSNDGGKSFGPAASVPGSDASGNRGWESAAVTPQGDVVAVWLDHREVPARTPGAATGGAHQHGATSQRPAAEGVARAQLSQIFFARLNEPASARAIAPGVCYCCKTSVATGAAGTVVAAWRHVYPGNIRDIALATSSDGGRTFASPVRVSEDNWVLDGCPENGPAVAIDQDECDPRRVAHVGSRLGRCRRDPGVVLRDVEGWPTLHQAPADSHGGCAAASSDRRRAWRDDHDRVGRAAEGRAADRRRREEPATTTTPFALYANPSATNQGRIPSLPRWPMRPLWPGRAARLERRSCVSSVIRP